MNLRSESGAIGISALIGIAIAGLAVYLLLGATKADTAHYGSVPVPGAGAIELPKGEAQIYYAVATGVPFATPTNLNFQLVDGAGNPLKTDFRGDQPQKTDTGMTQLVGSVSVPADGTYSVTTTGTPANGAVKPMITFGESPFGAIKDRFSNVVDSLIGPTGVLVLIVLGLLFVFTRFRSAMLRSSG